MSATALSPGNHAPEISSDSPSYTPQPVKSQRVLACVLCQQRKVKCDRRFPCANCVKSRVQCVPATLIQRRRRRRFPERDLLDRLRRYEDLLRQNSIPFEPMHGDNSDMREAPNADNDDESHAERAEVPVSPTATKSGNDFATKNFWHAMSQGFRDPGEESDSSQDEMREHTVRNALRQSFTIADNLLFGPPTSNQDLSALHPNPIQIFKLWQIYLDDINPLLKITHTPTLQGRIIEAASNLALVSPDLEALIFAIYCMTVMTLTNEDCLAMFSSSRDETTQRFRNGCQQALWQCQFLRTDSRDCLTAFSLYLMSIRTSTMPQSLSSMFGIAIRIAQRMGIHSESILAKCSTLEAEMRRRLWWFLVMIDARVGEMANAKSSSLDPTWDCKLPLNVNDSDLHLDMKRSPVAHAQTTEALFVIVRCELAEFVRHSSFHLDFTNPVLKHIVRQTRSSTTSDASGLAELEDRIEHQYLRSCDQESPVQFLTMWTARGLLARYRLMEYHSRASYSSVPTTEEERETATNHALTMLECDTKIMTSSIAKGFIWLSNVYFPFVAYNHIVQDLKRRPLWSGAQRAWRIMSENHAAHSSLSNSRFRNMENPVLRIFAEMIHHGWDACEKASRTVGESLVMPGIIASTKGLLLRDDQAPTDTDMSESVGQTSPNVTGFAMPGTSAQDYATQHPAFYPGVQEQDFLTTPDLFSGLPMQSYMDPYSYRWDVNAFNGWPGWGG